MVGFYISSNILRISSIGVLKMGFFKNLIAGGPKYMNQDLFNTIVYKTFSKHRPKYNDMNSFWNGSEELNNGTIVKTTDLFNSYMELYSKDDLISKQFGAACLLLEKHLDATLGHNLLAWQLVELVANTSDEIDANGNPIKSTIHINALNHPDPNVRPKRLIEDFIKYTEIVNHRIGKN